MCDQQPMKIHQEEGKYLLSVTEKQYSVLLLANLFEEGKKHCKDDDYIQIIRVNGNENVNQKMKNIFSNGVTIWHSISYMFDYDTLNS